MALCYKVRDTETGKYWNGSSSRSVFNDQGKLFKTKSSCEGALGYFIQYRSRWSTASAPLAIPTTWELVEIEMKPVEKGTIDTKTFFQSTLLRVELAKIDIRFGRFVDSMIKKGKMQDIEFLIKLKPTESKSYVDMDRIKEARAQLRQLGVKTRTFRETGGVFGMMDRGQALKARMVLDVEHCVDVAAVRKNLGI